MIAFLISMVAVLIDQATKFAFFGKTAKAILGDFLWFQSTLNTGVAFGMFAGSTVLFIVISSLATLVFSYLICSKKYLTSKPEKYCLGVILAGTFSNLLDRIVFAGVRDFIYLKFINFPIFNVADMCITLGMIALCLIIIFKKPKKEEQ